MHVPIGARDLTRGGVVGGCTFTWWPLPAVPRAVPSVQDRVGRRVGDRDPGGAAPRPRESDSWLNETDSRKTGE
jgi:hypothetical protein